MNPLYAEKVNIALSARGRRNTESGESPGESVTVKPQRQHADQSDTQESLVLLPEPEACFLRVRSAASSPGVPFRRRVIFLFQEVFS